MSGEAMRDSFVDTSKLTAGNYFIFRPGSKTPTQITGPSLTLTVVHESLIVSDGGSPVLVFGPGQWTTVGTPPI